METKSVSCVHAVCTVEECDALCNEHTAVVDFTASWCGPCRRIAPCFEAMAEEFPDLVFVKVDVDALPELAQRYQVRAMPTFHVVRDGKSIESLCGASESALRDLVAKHGKGVGARVSP